jgi:hypothetical protein
MTKREVAYYQRRAAEGAAWKKRVTDARAVVDAATDIEEVADAVRPWLLAQADDCEWRIGAERARHEVARIRRRANDRAYCVTLAASLLIARLVKAADERTDMDAKAKKEIDDRDAAESRALLASIHAMLETAR